MTYLLRKYSPSKWEPNLDKEIPNYSADAITGCTRTQSNTLSVWASETKEFGDEHVKSLVFGLAIAMDQPAKIDVVWLDEIQLEEMGLKIKSTDANLCKKIDGYHKDIYELDHQQLGFVGSHILQQIKIEENKKIFTKHDIVKLVHDTLESQNDITEDDLPQKWQDALIKFKTKNRTGNPLKNQLSSFQAEVPD